MAVAPVRLLLWLRGKLTVRGLMRSRSAVIGVILVLLVLGPYSLGFAGGLGFGLWTLHAADAEQLLRGALLLIGLVWTLGPLLGFQLNDGNDITRLFIYPVPVRQLFVAAILGCLFDTTTVLILPALLAVVIGAGSHGVLAALVALVLMPLFLFQTLAASQAVTLALQGILQSRRWRDVALVIVPLFWMAWQFGVQGVSRNARNLDWKALLSSPAWDGLSLLPPGIVARSIGAAMKGNAALAVAYGGLFGLITVVTLLVSVWIVRKAYEGEEVGIPAPAPGLDTKAPPTATPGTPRPHWLSPIAATVFEKEWRYFQRDPFFRLMAMNFLYMIALGVFMSLAGGRSHEASGMLGQVRSNLGLWMGSSLLLFQQTMVFYNAFGPEANAAALLFAFPASRRELLIGKNLAQLAGVIPLNLVAGIVLCVALKRLDMVSVLLPWLLLAPIVMAAVGNGVSVWLPYRVNTQGLKAKQQSANMGAGYVFLSLGVTLASLVLYIPLLGAVLVPYLLVGTGWLASTVPLAIVYTIGLYVLSLKVSEPWLREREPEIVEKVARPDA